MIDPRNPDYQNTPVSPQRCSFNYAGADLSGPPYVTIITPFYNTGPIFLETVLSVMGQSFQQWEWLIVNDGSTDLGALAILDSFRDCDPRIRVLDHDRNRGLSAARNTGFRMAQTPYVVQIDSDDLLEPTAVEKWFWFLESYPEYSFVKGYSVGFEALQYLWEKGFHNGKTFLEENQVDATCMIRRAVHLAVGGYNEANRDGLEDWDFWLRCASNGYWGGTVPEYLDWYRRRPDHGNDWANWDNSQGHSRFRKKLRQRYPKLWKGGFPRIQSRYHMPNQIVSDELPSCARLQKIRPRLLMLLPWLTAGGSDKFNLDLLKQMTRQGWEVSIATTVRGDHSWLPHFARYTPDIFILHHFLRLLDYPRFLRYLIHSRQIDVILISNSELSYTLLPYLRAHFPQVTFVDYCHMEQENWKNGGYPRMAIEYQELLDLNIVSSQYLREWMIQRGAEPDRVGVCYTNVDTDDWRPNFEVRKEVRREFGLDDQTTLILYAARICAQKQPDVFARTLHLLREQNLDFGAVVAGDGPDLGVLASLIKRYRLNSSVRLLGSVPNTSVQDLMAAADIFFLPSLWEGIALSIYEAMACGLPVVGADVGGQCELVTSECGVLIKPGDQETQYKAYAAVLANLIRDPQRRKKMGQSARARVYAHFPINQSVDRIIKLIERAVTYRKTLPRPTPGLGLGRACATEAIEYFRLFQLAEELWAERNQSFQLNANHNRSSWRVRFYQKLYRWHEPYYRWYSSRGWTWLTPIRQKIRQVLMR